jgi:hypothetical protein
MPGVQPGFLKHQGAVQFLVASHSLNQHENRGYPTFSDNDSFTARGESPREARIVRGVLFTTTGSRFTVLDFNQTWEGGHATTGRAEDDHAQLGDMGLGGNTASNHFKLVLSSTSGAEFANDESAGLRIYTASLDPNNQQYIGKILNTDPHKFQEEEHLLYLDFAVEAEIADVITSSPGVAICSGSDATGGQGDKTTAFLDLFGKFNTRYTTPSTPMMISQPFGQKEYDLFRVETISDGQWGNNKFKVSIANIRKSSDPNNKFGSFEVQVRRFSDTDSDTEIVERYPECNLNPKSDRYIARLIGDKKVTYNFDADDLEERRLLIAGKYPNKSSRVRISMHLGVENEEIPQESLPFGFRGIPVLKTSETLTDSATGLKSPDGSTLGTANIGVNRLTLSGTTGASDAGGDTRPLSGSIVPPLPLRFKITRGDVHKSAGALGRPGDDERVDGRYYWGVKFSRTPVSSSAGNGSRDLAILNTNISKVANPLVESYTKFQGIQLMDTLVLGLMFSIITNLLLRELL